ncbi:MAG: hypothetical protein IPJ67_00035 [Candidatus Moraniibacteriota bacterium]|nr:MAG: hypothetical protein IPJ67_00035 [Candidatus Moranbacteria bacterium]
MKNALGGAFSVVLVFVISLGVFVNQAKAASLTALSDTQSRVKKTSFPITDPDSHRRPAPRK